MNETNFFLLLKNNHTILILLFHLYNFIHNHIAIVILTLNFI